MHRARAAVSEEVSILDVFSRHANQHPAVHALIVVVVAAVLLLVALCVLCCCLQPCIVHALRLVGMRSAPYQQFYDLGEDRLRARAVKPFWWRRPDEEEQARREWVVFMARLGDRAGLRRLGWASQDDPERAFYGRTLAKVQRAVELKVGDNVPDVLLDLNNLAIRLRRPITFKHREAGFREPELAGVLVRQVSMVVAALNKELQDIDVAPPCICIDGYTAEVEPAAAMRQLSYQRATNTRRALAAQLSAHLPPSQRSAAEELVYCVGHGGARLQRGVEIRILTPTQAREFQEARAAQGLLGSRRASAVSLLSEDSETSSSGTLDLTEQEERMKVWAHYYAQIGDLSRARAFGFRDDKPGSPTRRRPGATGGDVRRLTRWPERPPSRVIDSGAGPSGTKDASTAAAP